VAPWGMWRVSPFTETVIWPDMGRNVAVQGPKGKRPPGLPGSDPPC